MGLGARMWRGFLRVGDQWTKRLIGDHSQGPRGQAPALQGAHGGQLPDCGMVPARQENTLADLQRPVAMSPGFIDSAGGEGAKAVVLFVDDQSSARTLAKASLIKAGYEVILAESREAALEKLTKHGWKIDIVVTDIKMGTDDAGIELIKDIRPRYPKVKILAITGFSEHQIAIDVTNAGADRYIEKSSSYLEKMVEMVNGLRADQELQLQAEVGALIYGLMDYLGNVMVGPDSGLQMVEGFMSRDDFSVETVLRIIGTARNSINRILTVISQLRALIESKISLAIGEVDLAETLVSKLTLGKNTRFETASSTGLTASIDSEVFVKAMQIFLASAEKAVGQVKDGVVTIYVGQENGQVVVKISDNGKREEPLTLKKLAELPFVKTQTFLYEDYLAMSLALKYVRAHGADIVISGDGNPGTEIAIRFSLRQEVR